MRGDRECLEEEKGKLVAVPLRAEQLGTSVRTYPNPCPNRTIDNIPLTLIQANLSVGALKEPYDDGDDDDDDDSGRSGSPIVPCSDAEEEPVRKKRKVTSRRKGTSRNQFDSSDSSSDECHVSHRIVCIMCIMHTMGILGIVCVFSKPCFYFRRTM